MSIFGRPTNINLCVRSPFLSCLNGKVNVNFFFLVVGETKTIENKLSKKYNKNTYSYIYKIIKKEIVSNDNYKQKFDKERRILR